MGKKKMIFRIVFIVCAVSEKTAGIGNDVENDDRRINYLKNVKSEVVEYEYECDYAEFADDKSFPTKKIVERDDLRGKSYEVGKREESYSERAGNSELKDKEEAEVPLRRKLRIQKRTLDDSQSRSWDNEENGGGVGGTGNESSHYIRDKLCRLCGVKFRFAVHYEEHFQKEHPNAKPYACPWCEHEVWKRPNFLIHIRNTHPALKILSRKSEYSQIFRCETCRTEHRGVTDFETHNISQHQGVKMIKCGLCDAKFTWFGSLTEHEVEKHGMHDAEFRCTYCKMFAFRSDELEQHVLECEKKRVQKTRIRYCENAEYKKCYECGEKFECITHLKVHFGSVHPHVKGCFKCKLCRKPFKTIKGLERHVEKLHADECSRPAKKDRVQRSYKCQYCGEEFQFMRWLELHGISHHKNERLFVCAECGHGFKRKIYLDRHEARYRHPYAPRLDAHGAAIGEKREQNSS